MSNNINNLLTILLIFSAISLSFSASEDKCFITQASSAKPNPSLSQCYKNNPKACCNSLADQIIKAKYAAYTTANCLDNFANLEDYFCLACSPLEPSYTNHTRKSIRVCSSFLKGLWGADLGKKTTLFDSCGMYSAWLGDEAQPILPSTYFNNSYEFIKLVKPPFFEGYEIIVVDDSNGNCYAFSGNLQFFLSLLILLSLFFYI